MAKPFKASNRERRSGITMMFCISGAKVAIILHIRSLFPCLFFFGKWCQKMVPFSKFPTGNCGYFPVFSVYTEGVSVKSENGGWCQKVVPKGWKTVQTTFL